ncbi:type I DNA topoisomerase [bacterium]|nr:type I DNA topoisomerase [bacterium]
MNLVIVESPAKAKTISHFLGKDYQVVASYGHIRDLPKSKLGVDKEHNFQPHYIIPRKSRKIVSSLKKLASTAEKVILATDEDREGEAIAWHLATILEPKNKKIERIVFHEITKPAIIKALQNPRTINLQLVNAQQARRILDRLVGYELSPFLWKKVFRGLSAGRVQSPALRLIVERERERTEFKPEKYYTISAFLASPKIKKVTLEAKLSKIDNKPLPHPGIKSKEQAELIQRDLTGKNAITIDIQSKITRKSPLPPFTTATLQQTAFRIFRYSAKKTMRLAQSLYEGKKLEKGPVGLITYMRTDSVNISPVVIGKTFQFIEENYGPQYLLPKARLFKNKSRLAQEAHEAIRPTDPFLTPEKIKRYLTKEEYNLYNLIWCRFIATQMPEAKINRISLLFQVKGKHNYLLKTNLSQLLFDGFLKVYRPFTSTETTSEKIPLPSPQDVFLIKKVKAEEHLTQPPPRYNDASLVKTLESYGIGRPSTYAPIISLLLERNYVMRDENKALFPTDTGFLVADILIKHFPQIVDYQFTSLIEEKLDDIAKGKLEWVEVVKSFYYPFAKNLEKKYQEVSKEDIVPIEKLEEKCPLCGASLIIRYGRFGKFISCSNWPKCPYTRSLNNNELDIPCPKCHIGKVVIKRNKRGKIFYACSRYPECDWTSSQKPSKQPKQNQNDKQ